jgi:hypothetical protein
MSAIHQTSNVFSAASDARALLRRLGFKPVDSRGGEIELELELAARHGGAPW